MKKLIFVFVLPLTLIFAQTNNEEKPIDLQGKFALMFQIDQNFDLNSFQGMSFAGKYFFDNDWGVRLAFRASYNEIDQSASHSNFDLDQNTNLIQDHDYVSYKVTPSILYQLTNNNSIQFFIGGGPFISYTNEEQAEVRYTKATEDGRRNVWKKNYEIGFNLYTNVEWFVSQNISLSAEYGFEYSYAEIETWEGNYVDDDLINEVNRDSINKSFRSLPVSLGVSIYF